MSFIFQEDTGVRRNTNTESALGHGFSESWKRLRVCCSFVSLFHNSGSKCWINSSKSRFFRPDATGQFVVLSWWKKKQKDGCCVDVIALYLDTDTGVIQSHQNNVFSLVLQYSSIITHLGIHELWKNQTKLQNSFIHLDIQKRLNTQSSLRRVFT